MTKRHKAMTGTELGHKLLKSVKEMQAGKAARQKTGLSQAMFAKALQISPRTLQEWEQGRREPTGAAKALIQIVHRHPEVIRERSEG